jgi:hypothetical protein
MRKKNIILIAATILILLIVSVFIAIKSPFNAAKNPTKTDNSAAGIVFFYGDGCTHCADVEKFFSENNIESKVTFAKKEVFKNKANAAILEDRAHTCGLNTNNIGVPFVWDGATAKCYEGEDAVMNFFKTKIGQ